MECWLTEFLEGRGAGRDGEPIGSIDACQRNCLLVNSWFLCCSKSEGLFGNRIGTVQRLNDSHALGMWNVKCYLGQKERKRMKVMSSWGGPVLCFQIASDYQLY